MNSLRRESANAVTEALNVSAGATGSLKQVRVLSGAASRAAGRSSQRAINARDKNAGASQGSSYKHTCEKL